MKDGVAAGRLDALADEALGSSRLEPVHRVRRQAKSEVLDLSSAAWRYACRGSLLLGCL